MTAHPIQVEPGKRQAAIGATIVTTAGEAGSLLRMGIYRDNGAAFPGARALDAGTISAASVGGKEIAIPAGFFPDEYLLWLAIIIFNAPTTRPTMNAQSGTPSIGVPEVGNANMSNAMTNNAYGYAGSAVGGVLPDPFPVGASSENSPIKMALKTF